MNDIILSLRKKAMAIILTALMAGPATSFAATVDLLVLYDNYSNNYFSGDPQTAMQSWVNQMNDVYRVSQVDIQLRLVGVRPHEETGSTMSAVLGNLRVDNAVIALRDQLGADFVSQLHQTGSCGVGYVAVSAAYAWNVTGPQCGPLTMIHELGHNMGLRHSRRQGDTGGTRYRYALGHGVDNVFASVMAYPSVFNTSRVGTFSNPDLLCRGVACGVPIGQTNEAHAARAVHNVRDEVAAFRLATGGSSSGGSSSGGSSSGGSSSGGSSSGGGSCSGLAVWNASAVYNGGDQVQHSGVKYQAKWWTQGDNPAQSGQWGAWENLGSCGGSSSGGSSSGGSSSGGSSSGGSSSGGSSSGGSSSGGSSSGGSSSGGSSSGGSSSGGGTCSGIPQYVDGSSYSNGDTVQNLGNQYTCTVAGWCSLGGPYAPGVGWAWANAWSQTGTCQ